MQQTIQKFLHFKHGIMLKNALRNNSEFFSPSKSIRYTILKPVLIKETPRAEKSTFRTSPLRDDSEACKRKLNKPRRGPLPWESTANKKPDDKCRPCLPLKKVAEEMCKPGSNQQCPDPCKPCRQCMPVKRKAMAASKKTEACKPFEETYDCPEPSVCEKRLAAKCMKTTNYGANECRRIARRKRPPKKETCINSVKLYPMKHPIHKFTPGSPKPKWKHIHNEVACSKKWKLI